MTKDINLELITSCISKDRDAQKRLYNILLPYLNIMCRRYLNKESDIKDVLQDTLINIFKGLNQYDIQKASFKTWATKIAINNCLKYNQKNKRYLTEELDIDLIDNKADSNFIDNAPNEEIIEWLKKMPIQYFEIFNMYVIDGFSHKEIAEFIGISVFLSRKRLSRARDWIKKRLNTESEYQFIFPSN